MDVRERIVFGTVDLPDTELAPRLLDRFYADGGRALDVANVYRDGEAARAVGKWLRGHSSTDGAVVYAKGCHPPDCSPSLVGAEVDKARGLLGVDNIDVFVLHRDDESLPVGAWAQALLEQVAAGRIGAFGVSNWTVARVRELRQDLDGSDAERLVAFSNHFSLGEMVTPPWAGCLAVSKQELEALGEIGLKLLAWSSLATGFFSGRATPHWNSPGNRERRDRAAELAEQLGTSTSAVALAYVLNQPEHVLPVVGTRSEAHLDDALEATTLGLTGEQLDWLETGGVPAESA